MFAQIRRVMLKEWNQLRRNREIRPIILLAPVIQMLAFGYAATTDIRDIPFVLCDLDKTAESRSLVERFVGSGYFRLVGSEDALDRVDGWLHRGDADLALCIPAGYGEERTAGRRASVQLLVDGTDSNSALRGMSYAGRIIGSIGSQTPETGSARFGAGRDETIPVGLIGIRPRVWYNPELRSRWFMVPAVVALILMVIVMTLSGMAIVRERELGTMEQLSVTPLQPLALILGKMAPFALIGLLDVLLVTGVAVGWFRVPLRGSVFTLLGMAFLFILVTLALGLLVSTVARTQQQSMMIANFFVMVPMIYLSGLLFPIQNMPKPIQAITWFLPLRYFAEIVRGVFLKGSGLPILWPDALALAGFAVAFGWLAATRVRKTVD